MPKVTTKSKHYSHQDKQNSSFDTTLDSFIETGNFTLTNEIVTLELLSYFIKYLNLNKSSRPSSGLDYKFYLDNVAFDLGVQNLPIDRLEMPIHIFLYKVFSFSTSWSVIGFDNVSILQDKIYSPLSAYFILEFLARFAPLADGSTDFTVTKALIITNAEFHSWAWMKFLKIPPTFDSLTLELLPDEYQQENFLHLCEALRYAKVKILNLGETEINLEGYHALNELLDKNYFIEKVLIKEPTEPESRAIFKKINERLPEGRTGKQRFDSVKFNQTEFLRFISSAQNALQHETDENEIRKQKKIIKFFLHKKLDIAMTYQELCLQKARESSAYLDVSFFNPDLNLGLNQTYLERSLNEARHVDSVYPDHAEYLDGRWPLFNLDLNKLADSKTRTIGYCLLEDALEQNDSFMVERLVEAGANLFEQQGDEKPLLIQIYEKNRDYKIIILNHIVYDRTFENTAERVLHDYSKGKEIMADMGNFFKNYAEILTIRTSTYLLSNFTRLFNLFKDIARLSRPSKQRDQEFIEIYWRMCKCLIFFHDARGRVTVESIFHAQRMLSEIGTISGSADWGWKFGSELHCGLRDRLGPLRENMQEIKKLAEKDDMIYAKDMAIQQKDNTIKNLSEQYGHLEAVVQQMQENSEAERQQFKATIAALEAQLKAGKKSETSELNEPGPSTRFFPRLS